MLCIGWMRVRKQWFDAITGGEYWKPAGRFAVKWRWQEDWAVAAGFRFRGCRGRKVRTPQGSVPDNVRDAGLKARGRPVPQKIYRPGYPSLTRAIPGRFA